MNSMEDAYISQGLFWSSLIGKDRKPTFKRWESSEGLIRILDTDSIFHSAYFKRSQKTAVGSSSAFSSSKW